MDNNSKSQNTYRTVTFSKDNPIVEISSKQSPIQEHNSTPPIIPKESKKEWGDNYRLGYIFNRQYP